MTDPTTPTGDTPLAVQISRGHQPTTYLSAHIGCSCQPRGNRPWSLAGYVQHIATVTEQAVRERIAAEIEAHASAEAYGTESGVAWVGGWQSAIARAARIARGATP